MAKTDDEIILTARFALRIRMLKRSFLLPALIVLPACAGPGTADRRDDPAAGDEIECDGGAPILCAGDRFLAFDPENPQLNSVVTIGEDGSAELPLLGAVELAGLSSSEAEDLLTREYQKHISTARLEIETGRTERAVAR